MRPSNARRRRGRVLLVAGAASGLLVLVAGLGTVMAITGASFALCPGSDTSPASPAGPAATDVAKRAIPPSRLLLYQAAGRRFDIDWAFLASIGAQECDHGTCAGDNGYGCAGPMQIAMRRGSPCSPGPGQTLWERFRYDANHDGRLDVNDPADAIFTAARLLRQAKGAPATGGSYAAYRQAACRYYGACGDGVAAYADTVMSRAVTYGFHASDTPTDTTPATPTRDGGDVGGCGGTGPLIAGGELGPVHRLRAPRRLASLPALVTGGAQIRCDARIVPDVVWLARRYGIRVTACYAIHTPDGEHPLGAAIDAVPQPPRTWQATEAVARFAGWKLSCAASGVGPACARRPFRFVGYNGYPGHGDPAHCQACGGGAHLHLSWLTSASPGEPENRSRSAYFAPSWIEVFTAPEASS
jgi:hypothetical protein